MPDARAPHALERRSIGVIAAVVVAAMIGYLAWPDPAPKAPPEVGSVAVVAPSPSPSPAVAVPRERAVAMTDWIVGSWSARPNGGRGGMACDPASVTTFLSNGQYLRPAERGRFVADDASLTYFEVVTQDIDAGEDMSRFGERVRVAIRRVDDTQIMLGNVPQFRCLAGGA